MSNRIAQAITALAAIAEMCAEAGFGCGADQSYVETTPMRVREWVESEYRRGYEAGRAVGYEEGYEKAEEVPE